MTDPTARDLIQRLITAIESESRERVISHDLMCSYIEARRWLDARAEINAIAAELLNTPALLETPNP
jgi:hypothetical protein